MFYSTGVNIQLLFIMNCYRPLHERFNASTNWLLFFMSYLSLYPVLLAFPSFLSMIP